ncbi:MAG: GNAT family N-acetyltransferase, partial [Phototrophicaceae bacterium]
GYLVMIQDPLHPVGKVRYLCVEPSVRRLGMATRLLRVSKQWALKHHLTILHAEIPLKNVPASRMFQKAGFHFCGFNDQYSPESDIILYYQNSLV